jgi:L-seryl-tRNA(Ser) seleniumtransferase
MKNPDAAAARSMLQDLPSVDALLQTDTAIGISEESGVRYTTNLARLVVDDLRIDIREAGNSQAEAVGSPKLMIDAENRMAREYQRDKASRIQRVINATGVIIHTNLGRAPLSENARRAMIDVSGYASVEYDLSTGTRGKRGLRAEFLLCEITGAEAAVVVNNCAAAAFLVLTVFASGGEVIISRGELVEIGGDFRVPDVLAQSGATLREVGTTNRTKLADYEKAFADQTRMILKVHPSNYRIVGFSSSPRLNDLASLAEERGVLLYEDAGSGALIDLSEFGITGEPLIADSIRAGVHLVTFSGDKLLGGVQAGIIAGKTELIQRIRKHPLYRTLRVDKIVYAALEATIESYRKGAAVAEIPVLRMIAMTRDQIATRIASFTEKLANSNLSVDVVDGHSVVGGGSAPDFQPETSLLSLAHTTLSPERLEYELRHSSPPVIARIVDGKVIVDLRTVSETEETELLRILSVI